MPARTRTRSTARATTNGPRACSRSTRPTARSSGAYQYTPNDPYDFDEISEHPIIDAKVNGEDRKLVVHAARNGFYYALDRTNGSFVLGKQYVDQLNWTTGLDPKTGRPLNYDPTKDVQVYTPGSHGTARPGRRRRLCPSHCGGKNWQPTRYNPELNLLYLPAIEGCNSITTVEQKNFMDQGGTVKRRERFTGGTTEGYRRGATAPEGGRSHRPARPRRIKLDLSELWRRARDRRQSCLHRRGRRQFSALDAKTLQELWSFNAGTGINAPPITYSVNGKQYVAVLVVEAVAAYGGVPRVQEHLDRVDAVRVRALSSAVSARRGRRCGHRSRASPIWPGAGAIPTIGAWSRHHRRRFATLAPADPSRC